MHSLATCRLRRAAVWLALALSILMVVAALLSASRAWAQEDDAAKILKGMSDYLTGQKTISASFDSDIEVITSDLQKIQFASSGQLLLSRPDKVRFTRTGGYADVELVFDGKTATVYGKNRNAFTQLNSPGSVDQFIDRLRADYFLEAPGADLLLPHVYDDLMKDVVNAKHIGRGVIDGVECEHLAFRNPDVDWQLWVEVGAHPIPRKYVVTSKDVTGAPQYTLRIKEWKTDAQPRADTFAFKPPPSAKQVDLKALSSIDEVPPGVAIGESK